MAKTASFAYIVTAVSLKGKNVDIAGFTNAIDAFNFAEVKHAGEFGDTWSLYIWDEPKKQCAFLGSQRGVFYARVSEPVTA